MKQIDRNEPKRSSVVVSYVFVVIGSRQFVSVALAAGFPLITQRSSVQIRPPQPNKPMVGIDLAWSSPGRQWQGQNEAARKHDLSQALSGCTRILMLRTTSSRRSASIAAKSRSCMSTTTRAGPAIAPPDRGAVARLGHSLTPRH